MSTTTAPESATREKRRARDPFPEGSRAAYEQVTPELPDTVARVLAIIAEHGAITHEQVHGFYMSGGHPPRSRQRITTIVSELRDAGLVEQSPIWGQSRLGNRSARWQVIEA